MTPGEMKEFKKLQERLRALVSSQMTYPKTVISIARERRLTEKEAERAYDVIDTCSKIVEAEMTLFALMTEKL